MTYDENSIVHIKEVLLERHRINCSVDFPLNYSLADKASIDHMIDYASMSFRLGLRTYMLQGPKGAETFYYVPATWWDHFKQRWFPQWAVSLYPIKLTKLQCTHYAVCPHSNSKWPDAKHMRFLYMGEENN